MNASKNRLIARVKDYWAEKGIPDQPEDATPTPEHLRWVGTVVCLVVGFVTAGVVLMPFAVAVWQLTDLPAVLIGLPGAFVGYYASLFLGGPIADELLGIERRVDQ